MNLATSVQAIADAAAPKYIHVEFSRSGSAYLIVGYEASTNICSTNVKEVYLRVSDHPHPSGFSGDADLCGTDAEGVEVINSIFDKIDSELFPPINGRGGAGR